MGLKQITGGTRWTVIALVVLAAIVAAAAGGAALVVWSGWYDISANRQHTQAVYTLLEKTMHQSVKLRARDLAVPPLRDDGLIARGALCYQAKCVQCHGGPGVAQDEIGRSMQPLPGPLVDASAKWKPAELYWITRNGIKMSGMPAWQHRMPDQDLWAVVAFMQRLPMLTAAEFRHMAAQDNTGAQCVAPVSTDTPSSVADARRGRQSATQYACNACHRIPGVTGSDVSVGPPLDGFARRQTIAGAVPNNPEQLVRWIRDPQAIDPLTTMPNMQVSQRDAEDIAAYLLTLD